MYFYYLDKRCDRKTFLNHFWITIKAVSLNTAGGYDIQHESKLKRQINNQIILKMTEMKHFFFSSIICFEL